MSSQPLGQLRFVPRGSGLALAFVILVYVLVIFRAQLGKFGNLEMGFDLALAEQVIWNTAHGRPFATSILARADSHLGGDVILLELLLALPYKLLPSPYTLLLLQTLAIGLGALPLYALARHLLTPWAGVAVAFLYLSYVPLHFLSLYEFQPRAFALGPLFAMFYFLERERLWPFVLAAALCLLARSDVALVVAMVGLYALGRRKPRIYGLLALAMGSLWFAFATFVVVPHFNRGGHFQFFEWYANLGPTPSQAANNLLRQPSLLFETASSGPKREFLDRVYGPLAFLPLLRPEGFLVALPSLAISLLGSLPMLSDIRYQYGAMLYGTAFVGLVYALAMLGGRPASALRARRPGLLPGALVVLLAASVLYHLWWPITTWRYFTLPLPTPRSKWAEGVIRKIPRTASVAACSAAAPRLAQRERLYIFPPVRQGFYSDAGERKAEYILADFIYGAYDARVQGLLSDPAWEKIAERERFVLFRRRSFVSRAALP